MTNEQEKEEGEEVEGKEEGTQSQIKVRCNEESS